MGPEVDFESHRYTDIKEDCSLLYLLHRHTNFQCINKRDQATHQRQGRHGIAIFSLTEIKPAPPFKAPTLAGGKEIFLVLS